MGGLSESDATLRLFGDDLIPDEITALLGHEPTESEVKGKLRERFLPEYKKVAKTGGWRRGCERRILGDLDAQIKEILEPLTDNFEIWRELSKRYRMDMFADFGWIHITKASVSVLKL